MLSNAIFGLAILNSCFQSDNQMYVISAPKLAPPEMEKFQRAIPVTETLEKRYERVKKEFLTRKAFIEVKKGDLTIYIDKRIAQVKKIYSYRILAEELGKFGFYNPVTVSSLSEEAKSALSTIEPNIDTREGSGFNDAVVYISSGVNIYIRPGSSLSFISFHTPAKQESICFESLKAHPFKFFASTQIENDSSFSISYSQVKYSDMPLGHSELVMLSNVLEEFILQQEIATESAFQKLYLQAKSFLQPEFANAIDTGKFNLNDPSNAVLQKYTEDYWKDKARTANIKDPQQFLDALRDPSRNEVEFSIDFHLAAGEPSSPRLFSYMFSKIRTLGRSTRGPIGKAGGSGG